MAKLKKLNYLRFLKLLACVYKYCQNKHNAIISSRVGLIATEIFALINHLAVFQSVINFLY